MPRYREVIAIARSLRSADFAQAAALLGRSLSATVPAPGPDHHDNGTSLDAIPELQDSVAVPIAPATPRVESVRSDDGDSATPSAVPARSRGARPPSRQPPEHRESQFLSLSFRGVAGARAYRLYIPSSYRGEACALFVMLHGCLQSSTDFAAGTRMNEFAEEFNFIVAYPEQPASANSSRCWNWFNPQDQQRDQGEPSLIAGITREIMREHAIDPKRVYVAGLSAGAAAAAVLGATYPDLYAAIGVHSGLMCGAAHDVPSAFAAMRGMSGSGSRARALPPLERPMPTIVFHGDHDATVHPRNAEQFSAAVPAEWIKRSQTGEVPGGRGYTQTTYTDRMGHDVLEQWVIHGANHAWSGGSAAGSYTDPRGPDASRELVRFFFSHSLTTNGEAVRERM